MAIKQTELFSEAEVGPRIVEPKPKYPCTPDSPGTGPEGETCGSCRHKTHQGGVAGRYLKCGLMHHRWSRGAGTDIKARWPSCSKWEPKESKR